MNVKNGRFEMDANETFDTIMREVTLNDRVTCEPEDAKEEQQSFWFPGETVSTSTPPIIGEHFRINSSQVHSKIKVVSS